MANPLGAKTFNAGEVLTAADVNGYLMDQAVAVFDSTAARGSAIASPAEGQLAYLKDSDQLTYYSGAAWQNAAAFAAPVTNRNLIYNGAMQVAQRGTSVTGITGNGYFTADRWFHALATMGTWTDTIENDAPTGSGFRKSWKTLCTTADAAPAAGDVILFDQRLEGQDVQRIRKGTSSAQQLTLSFWVKSNVTGTYVLNLLDNDNSRVVGAQYTISASGTWEKKTITFPADTTGAFDNDNALSLRVLWWLGAGSDNTSGTLNTTWASQVLANRAVGQTNLAAATNNYWQITGVQLEVGDTATEFEFEPESVTLAKCERYYEKSYNLTTAPGTANSPGPKVAWQERNLQDGSGNYRFYGLVDYAVRKRAAATISIWSQAGTTARATLNRAGNSGTTGFYNAYGAVSGDNGINSLAHDSGETGFIAAFPNSTSPNLDMAVFHFAADAEL